MSSIHRHSPDLQKWEAYKAKLQKIVDTGTASEISEYLEEGTVIGCREKAIKEAKSTTDMQSWKSVSPSGLRIVRHQRLFRKLLSLRLARRLEMIRTAIEKDGGLDQRDIVLLGRANVPEEIWRRKETDFPQI